MTPHHLRTRRTILLLLLLAVFLGGPLLMTSTLRPALDLRTPPGDRPLSGEVR